MTMKVGATVSWVQGFLIIDREPIYLFYRWMEWKGMPAYDYSPVIKPLRAPKHAKHCHKV